MAAGIPPRASTSFAPNPQLDFRASVEDELIDPVSHDLLTHAVTLDCGHNVNEDTLIKLLASIKICPVDRKPIADRKYLPNYDIRNFANKINSLPVEEKGPSEEAQAFFFEGKKLFEQGNHAAAVDSLIKALELCPTYEKAQAYLDFCLSSQVSIPPSSLEGKVSAGNSKDRYIDLLLRLLDKPQIQSIPALQALLVSQFEKLMNKNDQELTLEEQECYRWSEKLLVDEQVKFIVANRLFEISKGQEKENLSSFSSPLNIEPSAPPLTAEDALEIGRTVQEEKKNPIKRYPPSPRGESLYPILPPPNSSSNTQPSEVINQPSSSDSRLYVSSKSEKEATDAALEKFAESTDRLAEKLTLLGKGLSMMAFLKNNRSRLEDVVMPKGPGPRTSISSQSEQH